MKVTVDSRLTAYKVALWWTILYTNRHDTITKTLIWNSLTNSHLFHLMNCQEYRPPSKTKDPTPYLIVFRGPRCLVFMQLDPDHPGSPPFWNKVYISAKRSAIVRFIIKTIIYGVWLFRNKSTFRNVKDNYCAIIHYVFFYISSRIRVDFLRLTSSCFLDRWCFSPFACVSDGLLNVNI